MSDILSQNEQKQLFLSDDVEIISTLVDNLNKHKDKWSILGNVARIMESYEYKESINTGLVDEIGKFFNADRCFVRVFNNDKDDFLPIDKHFEYLASPDEVSATSVQFNEEMNSFLACTYKQNQYLEIPSVDKLAEIHGVNYPAYKILKHQFKAKSNYCFPLINGDKLIGALVLHYTKKETVLSQEDIEVLRLLTTRITIGIKHIFLFKAIQAQAERETLLRKVTDIIRSSLDIEQVLTTICNEVSKIFDVQRVATVQFTYKNSHLEYKVRKETMTRNDILSFQDIDYDRRSVEYIASEVFSKGLLAKENIDTSDIPDYFRKNYQELGVKSVLAAPIENGEHKYGVIFLSEYDTYREWKEEDIELLKTIAKQIYIAIQQAELYTLTIKQAKREKALRKIISSISNTFDLNKIKNTVVTETGKFLGASRCFLMETQWDHKTPRYVDEHSEYLASPSYKTVIGLGPENEFMNYWCEKIFPEPREVIFPNVPEFIVENNLSGSEQAAFLNELDIKAAFGLPILHGEDLYGIIVVHFPHIFENVDEDMLIFIRAVSTKAAIAMHQTRLYEEIKIALEREQRIRSDASIVIDKNLAKSIGLSCAITYSTLSNKYYTLKDEGKLDSEYYFNTTIREIRRKTCLTSEEQEQAVFKLAALGVIQYVRNSAKIYSIKVVEDENTIKDHILQNQNYINPLTEENSGNILFGIEELCDFYDKFFPHECVKATRYFLKKRKIPRGRKNLKISKLYFAVICRTFADFMDQYSLGFKKMQEIIDKWINENKYETSSIIEFGLSNKLLARRLKSTVFYRLQEAKLMAIDFYSKMDFYTDDSFEDYDGLSEEEESLFEEDSHEDFEPVK